MAGTQSTNWTCTGTVSYGASGGGLACLDTVAASIMRKYERVNWVGSIWLLVRRSQANRHSPTYERARDVRPDLAGLGPNLDTGEAEAEDIPGVVLRLLWV